MADIYDQHKAAFRQVSAFVVAKDGVHLATIALKFPADGAGRLYAYVHWIGIEMVRGFAGGGGYDKRTASIADACRKAIERHKNDAPVEITEERRANIFARAAFFRILSERDGGGWERALEDAGFTVWQAV